MPPSTRRQFLAAVPAAAVTFAVRDTQAAPHMHDAVTDAFLAEAGALLKAGMSTDTAHRAATLFRLYAAHLRSKDFDAVLQRVAARRGAERLLTDALSPKASQQWRDDIAAHFPGYRLDAPDPATFITVDAMRHVTTGELRLTETLVAAAAYFDSNAFRGLVQNREVAPGIVARTIQQGDCTIVRMQLDTMAQLVRVACISAVFDPSGTLALACAAANATYLIWWGAAKAAGC